jgi:flagellar M-ring protein FliF
LSTLTNSWESARAWWQSATPPTRAAASAMLALLVVGLIAAVILAASPDYVTIYQGITGEDAAQIESVLHDKSIQMHYSAADQSVSVPSKDADNAQMYVAAAGVLSKKAVQTDPGPLGGFSWTDSGSGMTNARLLNVREGQLEGMLTQLDPVQDANVKLTAGDNTSMFDDATPPSASVVLTLRPGQSLSSDQAKGIASLVAGANPGMDVKNVTITDQTGTTLWPASGEDGDQNNASDRFAAREQTKIQSLLDSTIGAGKSRVTVSAELDFDQIKKEIVQHLPTVPGGSSSLPLSTNDKKTTYSGAGASGAGGPAGTSANLSSPSYTSSGANGTGGAYKSDDQVINYVDNVDTTEIIAAPGSLKQLLVGVMIDSSIAPSTATAFQREITTLVGVSSTDTGRQVIVQQIPFDTSAQKAAVLATKTEQTQVLMSNLIRAAVALAVIGALLFLATRGMRQISAPHQQQMAFAGEGAHIGLLDQNGLIPDEAMLEERPLRIEDVLAEMPEVLPNRPRRRQHAPAIEEQQDMKLESVQEMISGSPQSVALLLKGWMADDAVRVS